MRSHHSARAWPSRTTASRSAGDLHQHLIPRGRRENFEHQVKRHGGDFREEFIEGRRVGGGQDVVAVAAPHRGFGIPRSGDGEDDRSG